MFSISSFRKHRDEEKENNFSHYRQIELVNVDYQNVNSGLKTPKTAARLAKKSQTRQKK